MLKHLSLFMITPPPKTEAVGTAEGTVAVLCKTQELNDERRAKGSRVARSLFIFSKQTQEQFLGLFL